MPTVLGHGGSLAERCAAARRPGVCRTSALTLAFLSTVALLLGAPTQAAAQNQEIRGTVVDGVSLQPLAGAEVLVVGTTVKAQSDANGRFRLSGLTGPEVLLQVRLVTYGMVQRRVRVGDPAVRIELRKTAVTLDALVVTGTAGATEQRAVGNAVSRTDVADVMRTAPANDIQTVLADRAPGVTTMATQGNVGSGAMIRIRGITSMFLPNDPLVYIDGIRMDSYPRAGPYIRGGSQVSRLGDLGPEEIEAIEIVKGPAAAALYGTEASRGVIQVLTRRGVSGPARFELTVRQGATWFPNPGERLNPVYGRDTAGQVISVDLYKQEMDAGRPVFSTGRPESYAFNMSGGTPTVRYFASVGYDRDEGVVPYDWRDRVSARANLSVVPTDRLTVEAGVGLVRNNLRLGQVTSPNVEVGWDLMTQFDWGDPLTVNTPLRGFTRITPERIAAIEATATTYRVMASAQLHHRTAPWLAQRLILGADVGDEANSLFFPTDPTRPYTAFLSEGDLTQRGRSGAVTSLDYLATATARLGPDLRTSTSLGAQYYHSRFDLTELYGHGLPVGVSALSGAATTTSRGDVLETKSLGVYAQEQVGWKNRRFLTAALRFDDHSAFGSEVDPVPFPKVTASWVLNEERFWAIPAINAFKLRAAWGAAGRQPDAYAAERTYRPVPGPGGVPTLTPQNVGNPDLKPERGEEWELGFDAALLRDRVYATFTYYDQRIRDAIVPGATAPSQSIGTYPVNLGEVLNRGIEATLDVRLVDAGAFTWEFGVGVHTNENRILSLGTDWINLGTAIRTANVNILANQYHVVGYPIASYFLPLVISASLDSAGNPVNIRCAGGPDTDSSCALAPLQYAGRPTPAWEGSVRTAITLGRNLRLQALVGFRGGNVSYSYTTAQAHTVTRNTRAINERTDPFLLAYDVLERAGVSGAVGRTGLFDASFVKLRDVSLIYTLPPRWSAWMRASGAMVTLSGRNLATLWVAEKDVYGFRIVDPEMRGTVDLTGSVNNMMPPFAMFLASIRVTF